MPVDNAIERVWSERLATSRREYEEARDEAYAKFCDDVRGAFGAGLSVTPIVKATGLTPSRLYQIKGGRRT